VLTGGALILGGLWPGQSIAAAAATMLVMTAGALYAVLRPERGVQDWLVGTWLVPS
jgi:hypothetical protein